MGTLEWTSTRQEKKSRLEYAPPGLIQFCIFHSLGEKIGTFFDWIHHSTRLRSPFLMQADEAEARDIRTGMGPKFFHPFRGCFWLRVHHALHDPPDGPPPSHFTLKGCGNNPCSKRFCQNQLVPIFPLALVRIFFLGDHSCHSQTNLISGSSTECPSHQSYATSSFSRDLRGGSLSKWKRESP